MGAILGRFRKKKTTLEQLEKLDTEIKSIEKFSFNTEQTERKIVGYFILISFGIYIAVACLIYIYFFPTTFYDRIFYLTPLLLVPLIILGVKRLLTWYYRRKISRNESKLSILRGEKKNLLDQVMDTETYKVAKNILEKFAPDQLRKSPGPYDVTPYKPVTQANPGTVGTPSTVRARTAIASKSAIMPTRTSAPIARAFGVPQTSSTPIRAGTNSNGGQQGIMTMVRQPGISTPLPLPREILPRDRSVLDKMVEYLVGDGPSNRYALICNNCQSHNGMALREEFEYVAFRCCYCFTFNAARKLRPQAPKLEIEAPRSPGKRRDSQSTSSSEKNSESDTESDDKNQIRSRKNSEIEPVSMDVDATPENIEMKAATPEKSEEEKKTE